MTDKYDSPPQVADNLPRDATGKAIPFDTERLYSRKSESNTLTVRSIKYDRVRKIWLFEFSDGWYMPCNGYFLDPPDSWESLEEDALKTPREYVEGRGIEVGSDGRVVAMTSDIIRRAKALAGVSDGD